MFCISCGASLPDNALFCPACGAKVAGAAKPGDSPLLAVRCTSCGSSSIRKVRTGKYQCEHCGTVFFTDRQVPEEEDELRDAKVAALIYEAQTYADNKDYQNERQALAKAICLDPDNNTVLLRLGRAYWRAGLCEKALEYYRRAEELFPEDPVVYGNIGSAFLKLGHNEEARTEYEKGLAIIEANPLSACAEDIAVAYGNYALCLGRLGEKERARKYLSIAKEKGYSRESINTICRELHLNRYLI